LRYLRFLGFPKAGEAIQDSPPLDLERRYSGAHPAVANWKPGEARALELESKWVRSKQREVVTFDASEIVDSILADFGPSAEVWSGRKGYGFREISASAFKKAAG
jgi:hypothetical protein